MRPEDDEWKALVAERFGGIAEQWRRRGLSSPDVVGPIVDAVAAAAGSYLLDAGCGAGNLSMALAERGFRVDGFDLAPGMIDQALEQAAKQNMPEERVRFWVGDLERIDAPDGVYDAAVCLRVLDFVPHPGLALQELWRVLKPGGRLLVGTLGARSPVKREWWRRFLPDYDLPHYANDILPWEVEALLGELGWEILDGRPRFGPTLEGAANAYSAEWAEDIGDPILVQSVSSGWDTVALKPCSARA